MSEAVTKNPPWYLREPRKYHPCHRPDIHRPHGRLTCV